MMGSSGSAAGPTVTVVVSTHNRSDRLPRLVASLEGQSLDAARYRVVIVDDGSSDDTPAVLERLRTKARVPFRIVRLDRNGGQARGRNVGWRAATTPLIAFTDDDCQPQREWLQAIVDGFEDADVDIVQGRTTPNPQQWPPSSPFDHWIEIEGPSAWFETCNLAYRREVLERVGGFDETYRQFCEDTDLGLRATAAGATATYVPEAHVFHDVRPRTWWEAVRATKGHREMVRLVKENPRVRRQFTHAIAYDKAQLSAVGIASSLLATAARPRSPLAWASLAWWGRRYAWQRQAQFKGTPAHAATQFAAWLAIDLAESVHLLRESVRQRTLLL